MCAHVWEGVLALGGAPCVCVVKWGRALGCRFCVLGAPGNVVVVCGVIQCGCGLWYGVVKGDCALEGHDGCHCLFGAPL